MVRSFSRVDPFPPGQRRQRTLRVSQVDLHSGTAARYQHLQRRHVANRTPVDGLYGGRRCHYKYLETSLGKIKCGQHVVTDAMVAKAVTYEKAITRVFDHSDADTVAEIIRKAYEPCMCAICHTHRDSRDREQRTVGTRKKRRRSGSMGWRNALSTLGISGASTQFNAFDCSGGKTAPTSSSSHSTLLQTERNRDPLRRRSRHRRTVPDQRSAATSGTTNSP